MKEIGNLLRKKRQLLDKTIEQVSQDTKITVDKIYAIEDGNLSFFEDDLSYLKFYVRHYFTYLNLDFDEYKDYFYGELDNFQHTQAMQTIEEKQQMNENIKRRVKATTSTVKRERRKIDYSMVSLIVVIGALAIVLAYVAINFGKDLFNPSQTEPPIVVTPSTTVNPTDEPTATPTIPTSTITVSKEAFNLYVIKGFTDNEEVKVDITFGHETWTRLLVDGVVTNNPASTTYKDGDKIQFITNAKAEQRITIHLGYYQGNEIYINGKLLELDERVVNLTSGQQIDLVFKGE